MAEYGINLKTFYHTFRFCDNMNLFSNLLGSLQKTTAHITHPTGTPSNQTMSTLSPKITKNNNEHDNAPSQKTNQETKQQTPNWYSGRIFNTYINFKNKGNPKTCQIIKQDIITVGKEKINIDRKKINDTQNKPKLPLISNTVPPNPTQTTDNTHTHT